MDKKGVGTVLFVAFLGIFGVFLGAGPVYEHNMAVQEYQNQTVATVEETDIRVEEDSDGDTTYYPEVEYTYEVDGETYSNDNVYPGRFSRGSSSRSSAAAVVNEYVEGSNRTVDDEPVIINYSAANPANSYLRNDDGWPDSWWIGIGYAIIALATAIWLIRKGFRRWRQRNLIKNTPTENSRSLSIGPSEIKGEAITEGMESIQAPFSEDDCVVASYEVEEYDDDDDGGSWKTIEEDIIHTTFFVDDGMGSVRVEPHEDAVFDLDPDDWSSTRVDSSKKGPDPVQRFIEQSDDLDYPSDASGKDNDRRYKQNLIRVNDSVYVFGTVQPRDDVGTGADNADRLVIQKVEDNSMREPMFMISDDKEKNLINRRRWALWRLPVGVVFLGIATGIIMFTFAPMLGLEVPVLL